MKDVLITGFSNFGTVTQNPSEVLVNLLKKEKPELHTHIFKGYKDIDDTLVAILDAHKPRTILMLGLANKTPYIRLERIAHKPKDIEGPKHFESTLPLDKIYSNLQKHSVEVTYSEDAGTYWCNYLFYKVCALRQNIRHSVHGFIHIPSPEKYTKTHKKQFDLLSTGLLLLNSLEN